MKIGFIWINGTKPRLSGQWNDGLAKAMRILSEKHEVTYYDVPNTDWDNEDVLIMWEAPCTAQGEYADYYNKVRRADKPKILLFAGGPINLLDSVGFDLYLVESELNEKEFEAIGLPWRRAFGVNEEVMRPMQKKKLYNGFMQATFAEWKRHSLFAKALKSLGAVAGRVQENDRQGYYDCKLHNVTIFEELPAEQVAEKINESRTVVNTASYWGGGQRCTLEAMACDVPVIVMNDSPKNMEYVRESGAGVICEPTPEAIQASIDIAREMKPKGRKYIMSKWTSKHYADAIQSAIDEVCQK